MQRQPLVRTSHSKSLLGTTVYSPVYRTVSYNSSISDSKHAPEEMPKSHVKLKIASAGKASCLLCKGDHFTDTKIPSVILKASVRSYYVPAQHPLTAYPDAGEDLDDDTGAEPTSSPLHHCPRPVEDTPIDTHRRPWYRRVYVWSRRLNQPARPFRPVFYEHFRRHTRE